jgi:alpha-galactosidase
VYGYDSPEGYAIAKDGKMYYAFFAPTNAAWKGEVELRGLTPGKYRMTDYADGKDLGSIAVTAYGPVKIQAAFRDHLLLEVGPQP